MEGDQGTIGFYTEADERWTLARITEAGRQKMAELARNTADWQGLGVAILHRLVIENLLDGKQLPKPTYVHLVDEVVEGIEKGGYPLAALVMPSTRSHPGHQPSSGTYARPEHLFLSEAPQRPGHQPAGISGRPGFFTLALAAGRGDHVANRWCVQRTTALGKQFPDQL